MPIMQRKTYILVRCKHDKKDYVITLKLVVAVMNGVR